MKIVFVSLMCYDTLYSDVVAAHPGDPDFFDREVIARHSDPIHKWCKMILENGGNAELWYLSALSKSTAVFQHRYGHVCRRIPGFQLGKYFGRFLECDCSSAVFRELRRHRLTHVLLVPYLQNRFLPVDMSDIVIRWCQRAGIKVYPVYGGASISDYGPLKRAIKAHVLRSVDGLLCQSRRELGIMRDQHRFPMERLHYFKNPLDLDNFHAVARAECNSRLGLSGAYRYLLYIGRLVQAKGVHHLVRIMPKILETEPACKLLIVGWGSMETQLRSMVETLHLEHDVSIIPSVANEELKYYYSLADIVVLPSYSEGTPNVLMEAIACGTPCVATTVGGIPDLLGEGVGIMVPPKDEAALLGAIQAVLSGRFTPNAAGSKALVEEIDIDRKGVELERILRAPMKGDLATVAHGSVLAP